MLKIRPNRHTIALAAMLLAMWYASSAQQNGGAFVLTFLTLALTAVSLLHAWTNLRAVEIKAGLVPPVKEGDIVRVPLALSVGKGPVPCGLEITATGIVEPVFIEALNPANPTRVELQLRPEHHGRSDTIHVVVRSFYPLGFFTATREIEVLQSRLVLPRPEGNLPLPPVQPGTSASNNSYRPAKNQGDGEDFAGVREWHPGDSLRHVDWKAFARDRPMMVKLWSGVPPGQVWLNWDSLELPEDERARQLAKWIQTAEQEGLDYGLRLPAATMKPGHGPEHQRRCLELLASHGDGKAERETANNAVETTRRLPEALHEVKADVSGMPLLMMLAAIVFSVLPILTSIPAAGPLALVAALLIWWRVKRPVPIALKLVPPFIALAGTFLQMRTLEGLESGVAILLGMTGAKLIESRTPRDMQLLALLGFFLCLCDLSLDQAIGHSLWAYAMFLVITIALIRFRRGSEGMRKPLRLCFTMLAQALPFIVLLFFLFPRESLGLAQRLNRVLVNKTGMSDKLDPGSVASIARSQEIAFRAVFENGISPPVTARYWRCIVLSLCNGMHWELGSPLSKQGRQHAPAKDLVVQTITLSPHGARWLPAIDRPEHTMSHNNEHVLSLSRDIIESETTIDSVKRYKVASALETQFDELNKDHRIANTQVPFDVSERVKELAAEFAKSGDPTKIVETALKWFQTQGFEYTLEPGPYDPKRELDEFLFERKLGFCEHYAASFALLMRLAKLPSRVVLGYLGGEFYADHYNIRQSDAHAWAEVWIDGLGWRRVDPTAVLAPQRLSADLRTFLENGTDGIFAQARNSWLGRTIDGARQLWEHANYLWYERVVQFDEQEQFDLWMRLGLMRLTVKVIMVGLLILFGLPTVLIWLWVRRNARHPDPAARAWQSFCAELGEQGVKRASNEGPLAFSRRASKKLPAQAARIAKVTELYLECRYGSNPGAFREMKEALRVG